MNPRNGVGTKKLQVSVDKATYRVIVRLVPVGARGKNKSEVASGIIREWIWHNQANLKNCGISLEPETSRKKR
jgi:hypothetical protein